MYRALRLFIIMMAMSGSLYAGVCGDYLAESEAVSGVVPRHESGRLASLSMYGVQSFIAPKASLINKARIKAELKAKREFANWIETNVASNTLHEELLESAELTSTDGVSEGYAEEISKFSDQIASNSSAVLSGIIKLDECVDKNEKTIYVRMGWKPSLSESASNAGKNTSKQSSTVGVESEDNASKVAETPHSGVRIITVSVDGIGDTKSRALSEALKQAVSQVFGQQFSSSTSSMESLIEESTTDSSGVTTGTAIESAAMTESIRTSTRGLIHSFTVTSSTAEGSSIHLSVDVKLAKYEKGLDATKMSIAILDPVFSADSSGVESDSFTKHLQDILEGELSSSGLFNILDRESIDEIEREMALVSKSGDIAELSRIGNIAGADRLLVSKVVRYRVSDSERSVGGVVVKSNELNATLNMKLIDPATSKVIYSESVRINRHKLPGPRDMNEHIRIIGSKAANAIVREFGGSMKARSGRLKKSRDAVNDASKLVQKQFIQLEEKANDDW